MEWRAISIASATSSGRATDSASGRGVDAPLAVEAQALLRLQDPQDGRVEARFGELPLPDRAHEGLDGDLRDRGAAG